MDAGNADIRERLTQAAAWATRIRETLQPILDAHGDRVHFRAASGGVAMVGLLHDRPQRGKSGWRNLRAIADDFEAHFAEHCRPAEHGRPTGEKQLQSALIRNAYTHGRRMHALEEASAATADPVELVFVSDELSLPLPGNKKTVCDILALRVDGGRSTPVLLELKDNRALGRLIEQVVGYSKLMDRHAASFAAFYGAVLGREVQFDAPTERWIVWPKAGEARDPQEDDARVRAEKVRIVGYELAGEAYSYRVSERAPESRMQPIPR